MNYPMQDTTIAAISTPLGTGGIGIVRMSGDRAIAVAERMFRTIDGRRLSLLSGYTGALGRIYDSAGELDEAIAFVYRAPRSYTGEDVVELSCHGGAWIVQKVLSLCIEHGARPASPGEFTMRAFLNGKLDLSRAEGVADLISSQSEAAARAALSARDGVFATRTEEIVEALLGYSAHLSAWSDYPDEDIAELDNAALSTGLVGLQDRIRELLSTWDRGRLLREGVQTVIAGRPNVGKSTLLNLLSGEQRSIVTDIPGTTRDVVEVQVRLGNLLLCLADTAGLRDTQDPVEEIGVSMARGRLETADLILAVFDSSQALTHEDRKLLQLLRGRKAIAVINKSDLEQKLDLDGIKDEVSGMVILSAKSGEGTRELEERIASLLSLDHFDPTAAMVFTERQKAALQQALHCLEESVSLLQTGMTLDAVGVMIEEALAALLSLTGKRVSDEVLHQVFSRFCIGK